MEPFLELNKKITVFNNRMKSLHSLHNFRTFFTVIFNGYLSNFKNRKMSQWVGTGIPGIGIVGFPGNLTQYVGTSDNLR